MTPKSIVFIFILTLFSYGCSQPEAYPNEIQKASLQISEGQKQSQVVHFDLDNNGNRLIRKFEPISQVHPNKLEVAIHNFLAKTNFRGRYKQLKFDYSEFYSDSITFFFDGNYDFETIADEEIFRKALELTITTYTENLNIKLVFNDKKF